MSSPIRDDPRSFLEVIPDDIGAHIADMKKRPTTFRPPFELSKEFPLLVPKVAVALHPHRATAPLPVTASKIGGTFYWPRSEEWPVCHREHDVLSDDYASVTDEPYLTRIIQITKKDVPSLKFPPGKDMFQMLWCTGAHIEGKFMGDPVINWRSTNPQDVLRHSNEHVEWPVEGNDYMHQECSVTPEFIKEYPSLAELRLPMAEYLSMEKDIDRHLHHQSKPDLFGPEMKYYIHDYHPNKCASYKKWRPMSYGTKLFGYTFAPHQTQYPTHKMEAPPVCPRCKKGMELFLTLSSIGYDLDRWCPIGEVGMLKTPGGAIRGAWDGLRVPTNPLRKHPGGATTIHVCFSCDTNPSAHTSRAFDLGRSRRGD